VTETPPAHWQHGRKYCVYVHLDEIHDYTRATVDHIGAITPAKRRLPPWQLGVADGAEVPRRLSETPSPPPPLKGGHKRERSPRRRDWSSSGKHGGGRGHTEVIGSQLPPVPDEHALRSRGIVELQDIFARQASALQDTTRTLLAAYGNGTGGGTRAAAHLLEDYYLKAVALAAQLGFGNTMLCGVAGNAAWPPLTPEARGSPVAPADGGLAALVARLARRVVSAPPEVPVCGIFARIKMALQHVPGPSCNDVEAALQQMEIQGRAFLWPLPESPIRVVTGQSRLPATPQRTAEEDDFPNIANLFVTPPQPALRQPPPPPSPCKARDNQPPPRRRQKRTFDMSTVRRSARLANAPRMGVVRRAQRNLCRKLGMLQDELEPIENVLQEYLAMFSGPLPSEIIAALTAAFNLDDEEVEQMDFDLAALVGDGIGDVEDAAAVLAAA